MSKCCDRSQTIKITLLLIFSHLTKIQGLKGQPSLRECQVWVLLWCLVGEAISSAWLHELTRVPNWDCNLITPMSLCRLDESKREGYEMGGRNRLVCLCFVDLLVFFQYLPALRLISAVDNTVGLCWSPELHSVASSQHTVMKSREEHSSGEVDAVQTHH